ncbi:MAG TPA: recombinase family protein [Rickettsia endosymbiont of Omalisus fontisbellaquei]|nr:recombinase family protein [Rickettsia endosymbiont of Omalisus fontisbellaquei]
MDSQTRRLNDYCKNKNLKITKSFEFAESSTVGNRKKFMEAIEFAKNFAEEKKKIIAIVIDKVDRLQRNFKQSAMLYELIEKGIIEIHFYTENCIIHKYSTSNEKLIWNLNVTVAQNL